MQSTYHYPTQSLDRALSAVGEDEQPWNKVGGLK